MNSLGLLVIPAAAVAGYVIAVFVPEELKPGRRWFFAAAIGFCLLSIAALIAQGWGVSAVQTLAGLALVLGTLAR